MGGELFHGVAIAKIPVECVFQTGMAQKRSPRLFIDEWVETNVGGVMGKIPERVCKIGRVALCEPFHNTNGVVATLAVDIRTEVSPCLILGIETGFIESGQKLIEKAKIRPLRAKEIQRGIPSDFPLQGFVQILQSVLRD